MFNPNEVISIDIETGLLLQLNHPNIIKMYEARCQGKIEITNGWIQNSVYYIMEYADSGDLLKFLLYHGMQSEKMVRFYMKKLLNAVKYLHSLGVYHRDIKLENIFIKNDESVFKLGDFGHAILQ